MTINSFFFEVSGEPKGQPRPRAFAAGGKVRVYDPGTAEGWKSAIAYAAKPFFDEHTQITGPCHIEMTFFFARPKRLLAKSASVYFIPHTVKPDIDNLSKAVLDALVQIGILADDRLIYSLIANKYYVEKGHQHQQCAVIRLEWKED